MEDEDFRKKISGSEVWYGSTRISQQLADRTAAGNLCSSDIVAVYVALVAGASRPDTLLLSPYSGEAFVKKVRRLLSLLGIFVYNRG